MFYAIYEFANYKILHVFEDRAERDEFAREHGCFVCDSKQGRKMLQEEVVLLSGIPKSEARDMTTDDLVNTLIECDYYCRIQESGLVELSRVALHWEV